MLPLQLPERRNHVSLGKSYVELDAVKRTQQFLPASARAGWCMTVPYDLAGLMRVAANKRSGACRLPLVKRCMLGLLGLLVLTASAPN